MKHCRDEFICIDCETTGLDVNSDAVIEVAVIRFTWDRVLASYESLVDPGRPIPPDSIAIHHITDEMVKGKPKLSSVWPLLIPFFKDQPYIVGHGVSFDLEILKQQGALLSYSKNKILDTLRLARLYGQSPSNSLESLRLHFNVPGQGAHRAMSDVKVNVEVFKYLTQNFKSPSEALKALEKPIFLPVMPLGKHKGRPMREIPLDYLRWAAKQDFDFDLLFTLRQEIKKRQSGKTFNQSSNPFSSL